MPQLASLLRISGFEVEKIEGDNPKIIHVRWILPDACPHCGGARLRIKARYVRKARHIVLENQFSLIQVRGKKFHCQDCGRYFHQRFDGLRPYRRNTEPFRRQIVNWHRDGISQRTLALRHQLGSATVERWYQEHIELKWRERQNDPCPRVLGIDEHFFSRRRGFATTLCNLERGNVFDVTLGRSEKALDGYLRGLCDRERVRLVCMDLSSTYRTIVRKYFPWAKIVTDRFHVIRLASQQFLAAWKILDPKGRANRGLLSLMRRRPDKLKPDQHDRLQQYLDEVPGLRAVYEFHQELGRLLRIKTQTARQCRRLIPTFLRYLQQLQDSHFPPLSALGKTLWSWREEIVRMWRFSKNNGITEGFHNKMEMISRRAFGFRNFENYRLRVRVLCS